MSSGRLCICNIVNIQFLLPHKQVFLFGKCCEKLTFKVSDAHRNSRINLIHRPTARVYHGPAGSIQVETKLRITCNKRWHKSNVDVNPEKV